RQTTLAMFSLCVLVPTLMWLPPDQTSPIPVRFTEGAVHGFLLLSSTNNHVIASGDLRQVTTSGGIENRTVFHFKDGSLSEETVVFTQQKVFSLQNYHLVQRGPAFLQDSEISLERSSGKFLVKTKDHEEGKEKVKEGSIDLPDDVYNGMISTIARNLPKATSKTVHVVPFMPEPRLFPLDITPAGTEKVTTGAQTKTAIHYVLHPSLGSFQTLFAKLAGRTPPDEHLWILADPLPTFVKFEGPFYIGGPIWRIELTSPRA